MVSSAQRNETDRRDGGVELTSPRDDAGWRCFRFKLGHISVDQSLNQTCSASICSLCINDDAIRREFRNGALVYFIVLARWMSFSCVMRWVSVWVVSDRLAHHCMLQVRDVTWLLTLRFGRSSDYPGLRTLAMRSCMDAVHSDTIDAVSSLS